MREGAVTYDEVIRAAIRILREGKNITKPLIRERLGNRGSHTTIQKHLDSWRETLTESDLEVLPPSIPVELTPHLEAFWDAATTLVESSLSDEWARANTAICAAEEKSAAAVLDRDQWEIYARDKDGDLIRKNGEIKDLRQQLAKIDERLRIRDVENEGLQDRLDAKDRAIASEREAMDERIDMLETKHQRNLETTQARWDIERQRLEEEAEAAKARAALEIRRSDQHEIFFLNEVRKARDETERARTIGEEAAARHEQEMLITRRREESSSIRLGQMEERLMSCQDDREKLTENLANMRETLAQKETETAGLHDSLSLQKAAADALQEALDDLTKKVDAENGDNNAK